MCRRNLFPKKDEEDDVYAELEERFIKGYKRPLGMAWLAPDEGLFSPAPPVGSELRVFRHVSVFDEE